MLPEALWRKLGGAGQPPSLLGSRRGPLLILGGARCVWDDYAQVRPWKGEILAVNDIGATLHEPIAHWVSLHPEYFPGWRTYRERHGYPRGWTCHAPKMRDGVDVAWPLEMRGGSSGLFAVHIALLMGYDEIVLAGVPMDGSGHYFDPPWVNQSDFGRPEEMSWEQAMSHFAGRVRSLSGRTRDWLERAT